MYEKILIAVDGSELAKRALDQGLALAKTLGSKVSIVTVTEPVAIVGGGYAGVAGSGFDPLPQLIEAQKLAAQGTLATASATASAAGIEVESILADNSFAAEGIIATAESIGAGLIVMGSHGRRGIGRLLLGSQTSNVLAQTKIPVLVTR